MARRGPSERQLKELREVGQMRESCARAVPPSALPPVAASAVAAHPCKPDVLSPHMLAGIQHGGQGWCASSAAAASLPNCPVDLHSRRCSLPPTVSQTARACHLPCFHVGTAGSGSIDLHELRQVLKAMGQYPTPVELAELMGRMDADKVRQRVARMARGTGRMRDRRLGSRAAAPASAPTRASDRPLPPPLPLPIPPPFPAPLPRPTGRTALWTLRSLRTPCWRSRRTPTRSSS